jgi:hypothetical protein
MSPSKYIPKQLSVVEKKQRQFSLQHYFINNLNTHLKN